MPAAHDAAEGDLLAVWQAGLSGLRWLKDLTASGDAIDLGSNGLLCRYTARARAIVPLLEDPPMAGRTTLAHDVIDACAPDEWLIIEAWDDS